MSPTLLNIMNIEEQVTWNTVQLVKIYKSILLRPWQNIFNVDQLTHLGQETHICVGKLTIVASDNGLSPGRREAIIWTNAGILLIGPLGTNFNEILITIHTFSVKKMHLKMSSAKWRPFCLGLNVYKSMIINYETNQIYIYSEFDFEPVISQYNIIWCFY